jgi:type IV pilus assembly protein PilE
MSTKQRGFSLIELLTAVAIVAVLSSIAVPAYRQYVRRADRAEARTALLENVQFLERNRTATNRYDEDGAGREMNAERLLVTQSPKDGRARYTIEIEDLGRATYTLKAVPVAGGPAAGDECGTLTLTHQGVKGISGSSTVAACWNR